ncbi:Deoxyguanosinetriphosphate triphosphohydrolase [Serratia marcescens]|uniref:Deoxyguanosinetriphosphate triphosphohydrolase n=1 Tax=Serratia marcescens TaxID=615 RepID=A0A379Y0T6_SERMA|nr:Deoxyguanosinetriphosphate triphosphohydrolase [Serratia marcescens]
MVYSLLKLNLTYAQVGCILKYTRPAYWASDIPASHSYLMKKPGYYLAEEAFVDRLRRELHMGEFDRFPLTYIMEAADDISYCVADLEDAVEKSIFTVEQLYQHLIQEWGEVAPGDLFDKTVASAFRKIDRGGARRSAEDQFFMYLRVFTVAAAGAARGAALYRQSGRGLSGQLQSGAAGGFQPGLPAAENI